MRRKKLLLIIVVAISIFVLNRDYLVPISLVSKICNIDVPFKVDYAEILVYDENFFEVQPINEKCKLDMLFNIIMQIKIRKIGHISETIINNSKTTYTVYLYYLCEDEYFPCIQFKISENNSYIILHGTEKYVILDKKADVLFEMLRYLVE